jgi:hypothetical protein
MTSRVHESRIAGLPCVVHGCSKPRLKRGKAHYSRFCADHDAEARAQRDVDEYQRGLQACTLAQLWRRWETHPDSKAAFVDGKRVCGMARVGTANAYRVILLGAEAAQLMGGSTTVELRHVKSDGMLRGVLV